MIKLENFDKYTDSGISYGGHSGSKKGMLIDGENWLVKYPKSIETNILTSASFSWIALQT